MYDCAARGYVASVQRFSSRLWTRTPSQRTLTPSFGRRNHENTKSIQSKKITKNTTIHFVTNATVSFMTDSPPIVLPLVYGIANVLVRTGARGI